MPFTAWKHEERNRHKDKDRKMTSSGFVMAATNNSFIDSKDPKYLVTILKALTRAFDG